MKVSIKMIVAAGALVLSTLGGISIASADDITVIATVRVKPGSDAMFKAAAEEFLIPSRREADNISYQFVQSPTDPTEFATIEHWKSQDGIDAHMASVHMQVFFKKVGTLFDVGYPQIRTYVEFGDK